MAREVVIHRSHREADEADEAYYRGLSPEERLEILLALTNPETDDHVPQPRFERVYRIVKLSQC